MRILLIQHINFINGTGGTEKICTFLANQFAKLDYDTHIATNQAIQGQAVFNLDKQVQLTNIYADSIDQIELLPLYNYPGKNPLLWLKFKIKKKLGRLRNSAIRKSKGFHDDDDVYLYNLKQRSNAWKQYIDDLKPDLIITMSLGSLLEITFQQRWDIPIINSTNGRPDYDYTSIVNYKSEIEKTSLRKSFLQADGIQILFDSYHKFLPQEYQGLAQTIPNPIDQRPDFGLVEHKKKKDRYKIINLASLNTSCKQQHLAIKVFAAIKDQYPDWDLEFWGTGEDYAMLTALIQQYSLSDRVFLMGFTDRPEQILLQSDIFLFLSKYEGFPLALGEAMAAGLPCIGLADCSGVNELIIDQKTGFLVSNLSEAENVLKSLISNACLRAELGQAGHERMKNYQEQRVFKGWEALIQRVIQNRENRY